MNALDLLKSDHDHIKQSLQDFRRSKSRETLHTVCRELDVHTQVEKELFYPAIREASEETRRLIDESIEEHDEFDSITRELQGFESMEDPMIMKLVDRLISEVESHFEKEETQTFAQARTILGAELDRLGERLAQRKDELMAPAAAKEEPVATRSEDISGERVAREKVAPEEPEKPEEPRPSAGQP